MAQTKRHYFDWAATALPADAKAAGGAMDETYNAFGNPSSLHLEGRQAKEALEEARSKCAKVFNVKPETLYFTSGGTESNTLVLFSFLKKPGRSRLLYSATEHPSVRENCFVLERMGVPAGPVAVEKDGRVSRETMSRALEKYPDARFAAIMAVNNETGSQNDMKEIAGIIRQAEKAPIHLHCDLVQAVGKIPVDITGWDLDSASISAHKLGGPRGIGLLYLRKPLEPLFAGEQERGMRPGTENTSGAMAMAEVLKKYALPDIVEKEKSKAVQRMSFFIKSLESVKKAYLIPEDRSAVDPRFSPWILQLGFRGIPGEVMLRALDSEGIAISTGSACSSSYSERPVLKAMGLSRETALEGVRISQGWTTDMDNINALLEGIEKTCGFL